MRKEDIVSLVILHVYLVTIPLLTVQYVRRDFHYMNINVYQDVRLVFTLFLLENVNLVHLTVQYVIKTINV